VCASQEKGRVLKEKKRQVSEKGRKAAWEPRSHGKKRVPTCKKGLQGVRYSFKQRKENRGKYFKGGTIKNQKIIREK